IASRLAEIETGVKCSPGFAGESSQIGPRSLAARQQKSPCLFRRLGPQHPLRILQTAGRLCL
ncbi:MAG TPA: hypothetical protein V6D03_12385, partial [Candidatus Caenarcaniphilales bacterium]